MSIYNWFVGKSSKLDEKFRRIDHDLQRLYTAVENLQSAMNRGGYDVQAISAQTEDSVMIDHGKRVGKPVNTPGSLEFDISSVVFNHYHPEAKAQLVFGYGKKFAVELRSYKLKVIDIEGNLAGEKRIDLSAWKSGDAHVRIAWDANGIAAWVNDQKVEVKCRMPHEFTLGFGDPMTEAPGFYGAMVSNVKWN